MPIRISGFSGQGDVFRIANGLVWAADHGARVASVGFELGDTAGSALSAAAQYFQSRGGVVTAAAGNGGAYSDLPNDPYILTVSAITQSDTIASWSNTGTHVDLAAPKDSFTTMEGGGYWLSWGTSYSAAYVAGVAALALAVNSGLTGEELRDILVQSTDDVGPTGWDPEFGSGRLNAERAVSMAMGGGGGGGGGGGDDTQAPTVVITSPDDQDSVHGNQNIRASASDNVGVTKVEFYVDGVLSSTDTRKPYRYRWQANSASSGAHTLMCMAYDEAGNVSSSPTITVFN